MNPNPLRGFSQDLLNLRGPPQNPARAGFEGDLTLPRPNGFLSAPLPYHFILLKVLRSARTPRSGMPYYRGPGRHPGPRVPGSSTAAQYLCFSANVWAAGQHKSLVIPSIGVGGPDLPQSRRE